LSAALNVVVGEGTGFWYYVGAIYGFDIIFMVLETVVLLELGGISSISTHSYRSTGYE